MKTKDEVKFWKKALKILEDGYGKPCKTFEWECCACRAGLVQSWIRGHIELITYKPRTNATKKITKQ